MGEVGGKGGDFQFIYVSLWLVISKGPVRYM